MDLAILVSGLCLASSAPCYAMHGSLDCWYGIEIGSLHPGILTSTY